MGSLIRINSIIRIESEGNQMFLLRLVPGDNQRLWEVNFKPEDEHRLIETASHDPGVIAQQISDLHPRDRKMHLSESKIRKLTPGQKIAKRKPYQGLPTGEEAGYFVYCLPEE